ncbi:MAG: short-chain dehydrogenase [Ignavibacteriae bacterium]|nr:MAG: short-chain dehydrogenase [Ignavibacteriota bacterium]
MELKDKIILVTGGSLGIGFATAKKLIDKGAKVIITARNQERLDKSAKEIGAIPYASDVSKEGDVIKVFQWIKKEFGGLDALINNAGYGYFAPLENIDEKKFQDVLQTNVIGAALAARESAKIFKEQNKGAIVNIASTAALKGFENGTAYVATKFALRGMTECWRTELRRHNVRVILINPSQVQTEFAVTAGFDRGEINPTLITADDIAHTVVSALEMNDRCFITELTVFATNPR